MNGMLYWNTIQVKPGTTMITGEASAQTEYSSQYIGGAKQWNINSLGDLIK